MRNRVTKTAGSCVARTDQRRNERDHENAVSSISNDRDPFLFLSVSLLRRPSVRWNKTTPGPLLFLEVRKNRKSNFESEIFSNTPYIRCFKNFTGHMGTTQRVTVRGGRKKSVSQTMLEKKKQSSISVRKVFHRRHMA